MKLSVIFLFAIISALSLASSIVAITKRAPSFAGFIYRGCYQDFAPPNRILPNYAGDISALTWEVCAVACRDYHFFSVQYRSQCWCGDQLLTSSPPVGDSACSMDCSGNPNQKCGEGYLSNVFEKDAGFSLPSTISKVSQGCYAPNSDTDALLATATFTLSDSLSIEACDFFCASYRHFVLQGGTVCQCGDFKAIGITRQADNQCNVPCNGDNLQICGSANFFNLYTRPCNNPSIERVKNPGFENGVGFWSTTTTSGAIQWNTPSATKFDGRRSARIISKEAGAHITLSQTLQLCVDESYTMSFVVKEEPNSGCATTVSTTAGGSISVLSTGLFSLSTVTFTAQTAQSVISISMTCGGSRSPKIMYLDNVLVTPNIDP